MASCTLVVPYHVWQCIHVAKKRCTRNRKSHAQFWLNMSSTSSKQACLLVLQLASGDTFLARLWALASKNVSAMKMQSTLATLARRTSSSDLGTAQRRRCRKDRHDLDHESTPSLH